MAALIFAQAKQIRKKCKNVLKLHEQCGSGIDNDRIINGVIETERNEFREILRIAQLLHEDYEEVVAKKAINWYFVTIRPKPSVTWSDFYDTVVTYVQRKFMIEYKLSFEQKSTEGTGEGFHVHIVCNTKHRSKGEALRDTISTFKHLAEANCIEVKPTRNPDNIVNNYLLAYKSEDDHKAPTQEGDRVWRDKLGLRHIYDNVEYPLDHKINLYDCPQVLSSSPETAPNTSGPIIIQMD